MAASVISWAQFNERAVGLSSPLYPDVINRALRQALSASGYSVDANFPGFLGPVYNVKAFGAKGDGVIDDFPAIQAAITAAANTSVGGLSGGYIIFPSGQYILSQPLVTPVGNFESIILKGFGIRNTYLYPAFNGIGVLFGTATPDASGTSTNNIQYCGMEDISVNGSLATGTNNIGVQMTQMQVGSMNKVIIESFTQAGSIGLYHRGSTTVGLNNPAAPHAWRSEFRKVISVNNSRPGVIENADENEFWGCNFGLPLALVSGTNKALEIIQGRNNRFYSLLLSGDSTNLGDRPNYQGLVLTSPTKGNLSQVSVYGLVAEGFDIGVVVGSSLVQDVWIYGYTSSINRAAFNNGSDDGTTNNQRQNNVHIHMAASSSGGVRDYHTGTTAEPETVNPTDGNATPTVRSSNTLATINSSPTTITSLVDGREGQSVTIQIDANTTIQHGTGANNIRCPGAANIAAAAHKVVNLKMIGGVWNVLSVSTNA